MDSIRPEEPVRVKTRRKEDHHALQYAGILFDDDGQQYRYRTNEDLVIGEEHLINTKMEIEVIVRITDAWPTTRHR